MATDTRVKAMDAKHTLIINFDFKANIIYREMLYSVLKIKCLVNPFRNKFILKIIVKKSNSENVWKYRDMTHNVLYIIREIFLSLMPKNIIYSNK